MCTTQIEINNINTFKNKLTFKVQTSEHERKTLFQSLTSREWRTAILGIIMASPILTNEDTTPIESFNSDQ